jgi:uncharacterized damage-inducible protein DinB
MPETLQTIMAERTRKGAINLIQLLNATPAEKLRWKPLEYGRTVLELAVECILVNRKWALTLRQGDYTRVPAETAQQIEAACQDVAQARHLLQESAEELADAILSVSDERLEERITAPFGAYTVAECCLLGYWNMTYHEGQLSYIQTLYGDEAMHAHF